MNLAAIDIGTNSTRLLICDAGCIYKDKKIKIQPLIREMKITRLGRGTDKTGLINRQSAFKTIKVLNEYKKLFISYDVERYRAVGTRVLRSANNTAWFIDKTRESTGFNIEVLSGPEEAKLSFNGSLKSLCAAGDFKKEGKIFTSKYPAIADVKKPDKTDNVLVVDIGGGSTEFILGDIEGNIFFAESIGIGSVSLTEAFLDYNKPGKAEIENLSIFIKNKLKDIAENINKTGFNFIVGLAGTISALASVDLKLGEYDFNRIHRHILNLNRIKNIFNDLCSIDYENRKKITGLDPERADIIIGGTVILIVVLTMFQREEIIVSENDILDGIIYSIL